MKMEYVIVQAGGKGTRLLPLTQNRPKSLVSVNNKPILFHLFERFPKKKFIIIGDYKFNVLARYLENFASVDYILVHAEGEGNASGIDRALSFIPENSSFMLIWSDLLLDETIDFDSLKADNYIGLTDSFECSWNYMNDELKKETSGKAGVAGCFLFENKKVLNDIPEKGSFTKYVQKKEIKFEKLFLKSSKEVGTIEALNRVDTKENRCRPYNRITIEGDTVVKEGLTEEAKKLINREVEWYKAVTEKDFKGTPRIYSLDPLKMERIHGENIFKVELNEEEKKKVIDNLFYHLNELHHIRAGIPNYFDMEEDYYVKTVKRLRSIRDVIPFSNEPEIKINGMNCRNVLYDPDFLWTKVEKILTPSEFGIIHGDCTLTNTLIDEDRNIYFIDARGYFGHTQLVGDVYYDWAKVYYSIEGAFDQFNIKNFKLEILEDEVSYQIASSGWEHLTEYFLNKIENCDRYRLKLIHAIVWLSLASHCWEDYDSLCLAFYNGLYLLNVLEK